MTASSVASTTYNYAVIFLVALGSFTYGFNASIMGTVFELSSFYTYFDLHTTGAGADHTNTILGATQGLFSAGGIVGCCAVALSANILGRKRSVQITATICIIAGVLQAAAVQIAMLLVGRLLSGVGSGMVNCLVPLYQSEVAPAHLRGRLVGTHGFLLVFGYAIAGWAGLGCYFESNPQIQWRLCLALQIVGPLLLAIGTVVLPESPRWLLSKDKMEEASATLIKLHSAGPADHAGIQSAHEELEQIHLQLTRDEHASTSFMQSLRNPSVRKRFLLGLLIQCAAQSTGVLVINNYQILLYQGLGLSGWLPLLLYAVYASWAAVSNYVGAIIVDRAGRVRMLIIGVSGCAIMVACEAAMVATYGGTNNRVGNGFGVFFLFCFVTFYATCVDPISYVYCAEIFPTRLRAQGMAVSVIGLFATNLIYTQTATLAFANIGWKYYLVFIIVPLLLAPVIWKTCPETKGLTLEEIGSLFGDETAMGHEQVMDKSTAKHIEMPKNSV